MSTVKSSPAYVIYKMARLLDQSVSTLDPLGFDMYFESGQFVQISQAANGRLVRNFIGEAVSQIQPTFIQSLREIESMAAARDLNMIASVATRFEIPMRELPTLEELLLLLATRTNEVPTDTVFGYGTRNPPGTRRRSFTKSKEENLFIDSFSKGMSSITPSLAGLETVQSMDITNPRFSALVVESTGHFSEMQSSILEVREHITPEFFTHNLRPFFEPKTLRGNTYFAAGGAQMPVTMVDLILWGVEDTDRTYVGYRNENLRYLPRSYRSKVEVITSSPSILSQITEQVASGLHLSGQERALESITSLRQFADQIIKFRAPHLAIAKANMRIRSTDAVGSGGYDVRILEYLISRTKAFKAKLSELEKIVAFGPP